MTPETLADNSELITRIRLVPFLGFVGKMNRLLCKQSTFKELVEVCADS